MATFRQGTREMRLDGMHAELSVSVPASPEAGSALRHAVRALDRWLGQATADEVELLVTELATNGVKHADPVCDCNRITLDASVEDGRLRVAVRDCGKGFIPAPREAERTEPGGWGLMLVEDIADRWGVEREPSTTVWFEMGPRALAA